MTERPPEACENCRFRGCAVAFSSGLSGMTGRQFSDAIYDKFGVRFDEDHCYRIIHKLGLRDKRKYAPR